MERLDLPTDKYIAYLTENEIEIETLRREIISGNTLYLNADQHDKAELRKQNLDRIAELKNIAGNDIFSKQLIARTLLLLGSESEPISPREKRQKLMEIIQMTNPHFSIHSIGNGLYTENDMAIINQIACTFTREGDDVSAIYIWKQLYAYIHNHCKHTIASSNLDLVIHNCVQSLIGVGSYSEANQLAKEGYDFCLKYHIYNSLPGILSAIAESAHFLGNDEESRHYYTQAYYMCLTLKNSTGLNAICADAKQYLDMEF